VEQALALPIDVAFASFDTTPLASASIAQVHAATLHAVGDAPPREVVVKVLRPGIEKQIAADVSLLKSIAALVDRTHPSADKIRRARSSRRSRTPCRPNSTCSAKRRTPP
jgi:ubiquinone biosynthesis protein